MVEMEAGDLPTKEVNLKVGPKAATMLEKEMDQLLQVTGPEHIDLFHNYHYDDCTMPSPRACGELGAGQGILGLGRRFHDQFDKGFSQMLSKCIEFQEMLPSNLRCPQRINKEYHNLDITDEELWAFILRSHCCR